MSREIKRVPLDFDAPLDEVWSGYQRPPCAACDGFGDTVASRWVSQFFYRIGMLVDDVALAQPRGEFLHPWLKNDPFPVGTWKEDRYVVQRPSADILDLFARLNERDLNTFSGNAGTMQGALSRVLHEATGGWGICPDCGGEGTANGWTRTDPPTGDGWQLWGTTSEGDPRSPVFPTAGDLAQWMTTPAGAAKVGTPSMPLMLTMEQALRFVFAGEALMLWELDSEFRSGATREPDPAPGGTVLDIPDPRHAPAGDADLG